MITKRFTAIFILMIMFASLPVSAVNFTMENRSINMSTNINYVVKIDASAIPMTGAQVTFNYNPTMLMVSLVSQGSFLYYAKNDAKIWHVFSNKSAVDNAQTKFPAGKIMVVSMLFWDYSITQTKASTLMTINMKPLRKGLTYVNLTYGTLLQNVSVGGMNKNYTIKIT